MTATVGVLFVCLGNICRSPTAHGVFQALVTAAGLDRHIGVDSAGTGDWHIGQPPDQRTLRAALGRGYDLRHLRARQVEVADFHRFDYVLAMDRTNLAHLQRLRPHGCDIVPNLFLRYGQKLSLQDVPDPYHGGQQDFDLVLDLVENAARGLLDHIRATHPDT